MSANESRRRVTSTPAAESQMATLTTVPRSAEVRALRRVPCRVRGCRETIPRSIGYAPDWCCWRHDRLVRPPLDLVAVGHG